MGVLRTQNDTNAFKDEQTLVQSEKLATEKYCVP